MNSDNLTLRDQKNKFIASKLLNIVSESYSVNDELDIIRKKCEAGHKATIGEPRMVYFFLLKKHTDLSYREMHHKLKCTNSPDQINKLIFKVEEKMRSKENIEFIYQVKIIERGIQVFIANWRKSLINKNK